MKKLGKLRKICLFTVLTLLMALSFLFVGLSNNKANAETLAPSTFTMEEATSAKLSSVAGIRFRVKLDTATKEKVVGESNTTITFVVTPRVFVNSVDDFKTLSQKITVVADETKFYQEDNKSGIWYANCVITGIKEANRKLDYSCVAFVTDGETTVYTSNYAYNNIYATLNSAVYDETFREYLDRIIDEGLYNWFGTENYPVIVASQSQYEILKENGSNKTEEEDLYIAVHSGITTKNEFINLSTSYIVTFNDYNGNLLKKVIVKAGEKVSSLPTVATSEENKMIDGFIYDGNKQFTTSTAVNSDITATANLVSYYKDTNPFVYDKTNGTVYTLPVSLTSATATIDNEEVSVVVEGKYLQLPANLDLTVGESKTLRIVGTDKDGETCRIVKTIEVVNKVDVIINSATDFDNWYKIANYSTAYDDSEYIVLNANIDLSSYTYSWVSSSTYGKERNNMNFNGTFNGQGYNIDHFTTYYGFMSLAAEGTIKNVSFTNVSATNVQYSGGFFAFHIFGTISNVYYSGTFKEGTASSTTGIIYQCNTAVKIENFVVVLKASEEIASPETAHAFASYGNVSSSIYVVNEVFNPTAGSAVITNGPNKNAIATFTNNNFFETVSDFKANIHALPQSFTNSVWTIDSTLGLVFKSVVEDNSVEEEEKNNNYFDTLYSHLQTSKYGTLDAIKTAEIGMDVYSKTLDSSSAFVPDYNYLCDEYLSWSYAIMSTVDTSFVYANGWKISANTWYYVNIRVESDGHAYIYTSTSKYGTYEKVTSVAQAYYNSKAYTGQAANFTKPQTNLPLTLYMTNIYGTSETYDSRTEVTKDDVLVVKGSETDITFGIVGSQTISSTLIDGVESATSATISGTTVTIPASAITSLTAGVHVIKVETTAKIYKFNLTIADVAIASASDFDSWYSGFITAKSSSEYVVLTADITLDGTKTYSSDGKTFSGTFDGQGHYIKNLKTTQGMFYNMFGTFKNTAIVDTETTISYMPFIGYNCSNGTIENILYQGSQGGTSTWDSAKQVGGFYSYTTGVTIDCVVVNVSRVCGASSDAVSSAQTVNATNMYMINTCSAGTVSTSVNYYASNSAYIQAVTSLPSAFDTDIWAYDPGFGLTFKSLMTENNYFENLLNCGKNSSTVTGATVDTTYDIGMTVYKKTGSNAATFFDNYNNLKDANYDEWSFALMTTVDTSIIYSDAIKLKANTWYFFHVVVEDYNYNSNDYQVGQVYVSTSQYGTYEKANLHGAYLISQSGTYTCSLNNLIRFVTGSDFDVYMTDIYAEMGFVETEHNYGTPTYSWNDDYSQCTATRVCAYNITHKEIEVSTSTSEITQARSCVKDEYTTYTASFENSAFTTQVEVVKTASKSGHSYGTPTYVWSNDNSTCTATVTCSDCGDEIQEQVSSTSEVTQESTCQQVEKTTYTAEFENALFTTQTKTLETAGKTEHNYVVQSYVWSGNNSTCTATATCSGCGDEIQEQATSTSAVTQARSCENDEYTTYTATFSNSIFEQQEKIEKTNDKLGHSYGTPTYVWSNGNLTCTATVTCSDCGDEIQEQVSSTSEVTQESTCQQVELTKYTAEFENALFSTQTKTLETASKKEHSYTSYTSNNDAGLTTDGTKTAYCDYGCGNSNTITDTNSRYELLTTQSLGTITFGRSSLDKTITLGASETVRAVFLDDTKLTTGYTGATGSVTISGSIFSANGSYTLKVAGTTKLYTINATVVDYALSTKADVIDWYNNHYVADCGTSTSATVDQNGNEPKTVLLLNNIDMENDSSTAKWGKRNDGTNNLYFIGTFDGQGYTISNFASYAGVFCNIGEEGTVQNVAFTNMGNKDTWAGFLGGHMYGTMTNCYFQGYATGVVSGDSDTNQQALYTILNSSATMTNVVVLFTERADTTATTAISNYNYNPTLSGVYVVHTTSNGAETYTSGTTTAYDYSNVYLYATAKAFIDDVTALPSGFSSTYWSVASGMLTFKSATKYAGSICVASNLSSENATITLEGATSVSAVYLNNTIITSGYTFNSEVLSISQSTLISANVNFITIVTDAGTFIAYIESYDVLIRNASDFYNWYYIDYYGTTYNQSQKIALTADIDLSGYSFGWSYSGTERSNMKFNGTFDGQGHNIANFTCNHGFISTDTAGVVKNVSFTNMVNNNVLYSGGFFAKYTWGTLQNVYVEGEFTAGEMGYAQGALGHQSNTAVEITNLVIILHQVSTGDLVTDSDNNSYIIGQYAKGTSSMYIVNEIATVNVAAYGSFSDAHTYASIKDFKSSVVTVPSGFPTNYWTMKNGLLVMKGAATYYDSCSATDITLSVNGGDTTLDVATAYTLTTNVVNAHFVVNGLYANQYTLTSDTLTIKNTVESGTTFTVTAYYYAYGNIYKEVTTSTLTVNNESRVELTTVVLGNNRTNDSYNYTIGSGEALTSIYVDGVEGDDSLVSISSGVLNIPASSFDVGEHVVRIYTTNKSVSFDLVVADFAIGDATEFASWYNNASDYWDKYIALSDNVTLDITTKFTSPTSAFSGTFNGNGYTLYNFYSTQGLFYTLSGTFKNTAVVNAKNAYSYINFIGYNLTNGTISNVFYQGTQTGSWDTAAQVPAFYSYGMTGKNVKNVVVIVDRNTGNSSDPISSGGSSGVSSLYVVNNCSRGDTTKCADSNYYLSISDFMDDVTSVPTGFDTDMWTMKNGLLTFKSTADVIGSIFVARNRSTTTYELNISGTSVSSVYINDTAVSSTKYSISNGVFRISSSAFTASGDKMVYVTTNTGKYIIYAEVVDYAIGSVSEFTSWYSNYGTYARGIDSSDSSVDTYGTRTRIVLTADIDFNGADLGNAITNYWWKSDVGSGNAGNLYFIGSFDGRGYTLSNFTSSLGLFPGVMASGVIKNLNMENFTVTGSYGLLGCSFNGTMLNCNFTGKNNATSDVNGSLWNNVQSGAIIKGVNVTVTSDNDNSSVYGISSGWYTESSNVVGLIVINDNCNNMCATNYETIQGVKLATSSSAIVGYNMLDYAIVCENDGGNMIAASSLLATHMNTALSMSIQTHNGVANWSDSDKLIIFGNETLFKEQLENAGKTFDENAYYILKVGDTVFIYASDSADYRPAVIKFLELAIGYEDYGTSVFGYTNIPDSMPEMYYENVVTFKNRITGYSKSVSGLKTATKVDDATVTITNYNELYNMGYTNNEYMYVPNRYYYTGGTTDSAYSGYFQNHTAFYILPPEMYKSSHGAFYSTTCQNYTSSNAAIDYDQLCYTARSDDYPSELEVMKTTVLEYLKEIVMLQDNLSREYLAIQILDNEYTCQCSACKRIGAVAAQIQFMNDIGERLNDWLHSDEGGNDSRTVKIVILAYKGFVDAPTDGTTCNEYVAVQIAPISAYYGKSVDDSSNATLKTCVQNWKAICPNSELHFWAYQSHFQYKDYNNTYVIGGYMLALDSWDYTLDLYKFLSDNGVVQIFNQGPHTASVVTGFGNFKNYIDSKAEIDVDYVIDNYDTIKTNYFNNYFGSAAGSAMEALFESYKSIIKSHTSTGELKEKVLANITYSNLSTLRTKLNAVYQALENAYSDKTDVNYLAYKKRIDIEGIAIRFLIAERGYSSYLTSSYYTTTKAGIYNDMVTLGFNVFAEGFGPSSSYTTDMAGLKSYWGV